jgi:hypothetical protein
MHAELNDSLKAAVEKAELDTDDLELSFPKDASGRVRLGDRHRITVTDRRKAAEWEVPSLRELFRGERPPPPDIDHYPPEYVPCFERIERHLVMFCDSNGDQTDQDLEQVYGILQKRPDGKSIGLLHDVVWQAAALMAGMFPVSAAEFAAVFETLGRSTRRWGQSPISRNYLSFLRGGKEHLKGMSME